MDDDLAPSKTEGFKVGEKKTIDEYKNLGRLVSRPLVRCGGVMLVVTRRCEELGWEAPWTVHL